jgi:hypothetical protein
MEKQLKDINFETHGLVMGPKGQFISTELVVLEPAAEAPAEVDAAEICTTLNSIVVNFQTTVENTRFAITFRKTDTVKTAKLMVARRLAVSGPECVTLLFKGKALAEAFVLSRLRIGNLPIAVHVKDTGALVLVSAMAMINEG